MQKAMNEPPVLMLPGNSVRSKIKLLNGVVRIGSIAEKGTNIEVIIPQNKTIQHHD